MTISITISDATNLTEAERALLRAVLIVDVDRRDTPAETERRHLEAEQAADLAAAPVEPPEVYSPHTQVIDTAAVFGVQPPAAPAAPAASETDSRGLPWDARIHSETRNKNKDGSWRNKRGVVPSSIAEVEAELRMKDVSINYSTGVVTVAPPPPAPPAPPAPSTSDAPTFRDFMNRITPELTTGKLAQATLAECVARHGLASLPELAQRPELIPVMLAELGV